MFTPIFRPFSDSLGNKGDSMVIPIVAVPASILATGIGIGIVFLCLKRRRKNKNSREAERLASPVEKVQKYKKVPHEDPVGTESDDTSSKEEDYDEANLRHVTEPYVTSDIRNYNEEDPEEEGQALEIGPVLKPYNEGSWETFSLKTHGQAPAFKIIILGDTESSMHVNRILGKRDGKGKRNVNDLFQDVLRTLLGVGEKQHPATGPLESIRIAKIHFEDKDPYTEAKAEILNGRKPHIVVDMTANTCEVASLWYSNKQEYIILKHDVSTKDVYVPNILIPRHYFSLGRSCEDMDIDFSAAVSTWATVVICTMILWSAKGMGVRIERALRNTDNMRRILDHLRSLSRGVVHPKILWDHLLDSNKIVHILEKNEGT